LIDWLLKVHRRDKLSLIKLSFKTDCSAGAVLRTISDFQCRCSKAKQETDDGASW